MIAESLFINSRRIKEGLVILFDLDGTLLDTNLANNEAYNYGLWKVTGRSDYPQLKHLQRITRNDVASLEGIDEENLNEIIRYKQKSFYYKLRDGNTSPFITTEVLKFHASINTCYIITSAERERVEQIIRHYHYDIYVKGIIYADSSDKYKDIESKLGVSASNIILFENDEQAIQSAIRNHIAEEHIIRIKSDTLKIHIIEPNECLQYETRAFYSLDYIGYGHPGNPDFINRLKNTNDNYPGSLLKDAQNELAKYLLRDIRCIYGLRGSTELVVVSIPRAKAEHEYSPNQQLFRHCIKEVTKYLQTKHGISLIDGTDCIVRHTNTKTTHFSKNENIVNDGAMPYKGITKDTCTISGLIANKDVLLIDDIYTFGVNIDEDAIQALYDNGAKSVIFYSVCKTYKTKKK